MNSVMAGRNCEHGGTPGECSGITARSNQTGSAAKVSQAQAQGPRDPGRSGGGAAAGRSDQARPGSMDVIAAGAPDVG